MKKAIIVFALIFPFFSSAQESIRTKESGLFTLGMRSTLSAFSDEGYLGKGFGGQFRVKFAPRINSEWFADYITTNVAGLAKRSDIHIGWSVMFYPFNSIIEQGRFTPYFLAGHCFDYTKITKNEPLGTSLNRWSSAVHMGLGSHYNLTDRVDISLSGQYMIHLGKDIEASEYVNSFGEKDILIQKTDVGLEGHLFITLSVNAVIADLWGK